MSPWPLGIVASSGGAIPSSLELIATQLISSNTSGITFSSVPQDFKHLQLRITARSTFRAEAAALFIRFNGNTTGYARHAISASGSSVTSFSSTASNSMVIVNATGSTAPTGVFATSVVDILDYSSSSKNTTARCLSGLNSSEFSSIQLYSGLWENTAAVTSIFLQQGNGGLLVAGSRFSLYGIRG